MSKKIDRNTKSDAHYECPNNNLDCPTDEQLSQTAIEMRGIDGTNRGYYCRLAWNFELFSDSQFDYANSPNGLTHDFLPQTRRI